MKIMNIFWHTVKYGDTLSVHEKALFAGVQRRMVLVINFFRIFRNYNFLLCCCYM